MKNTLKLNHTNRTIIMDKTFAKFAADTRSAEYAHLRQVRQDYPLYTVVQRHIRKNAKQEHYHGLTYAYMEDYIIRNEGKDTVLEVLKEFEDLLFIAECHSKSRRYPAIKRWFLGRYPEVAEFGLLKVPMPSTEKPAMKVWNNNQELAFTGTDG